MRAAWLLWLAGSALGAQAPADTASALRFVFTSDAHYGITRKSFHGRANADAHTVNSALVATINRVSGLTFPADGGVGAGTPVGAIDFVAVGGDIANKADSGIQMARDSWAAFLADYRDGITLRDRYGKPSALFVVPGNHDASNAIGWPKASAEAVDATAMAGIYNMMARPAEKVTGATFSYATHRTHTSRDVGGVHLEFVEVWPDSAERAWMTRDLATVPATTPVLIFVHDPPEAEAKHFRAPPGSADAKFENLLSEVLKDSGGSAAPTRIEQRALAAFIKLHPNVRGYFHGHQNFNEFSTWRGPDGDVALNVFRADSPMKGRESATDETRLSFQVVTIDAARTRMTVRELFWNPTRWGATTTVPLR